MRHSNKRKGFTLIELLVVIAIIGILASVALAALNIARQKGADSAIKADLNTITKQSAVYSDSNSDFGADTADCSSGFFASETTVANAIAHATLVSGGTPICIADDGDNAVGAAATTWAVSVPLKTDPAASWCVDSEGSVGFYIANATTTADVASCL